jgi:hypothetical protein
VIHRGSKGDRRRNLLASLARIKDEKEIHIGVTVGLTVAFILSVQGLVESSLEKIAQERYIGRTAHLLICEIAELPKKDHYVQMQESDPSRHRRALELGRFNIYLGLIDELQSAIKDNSSKMSFTRKRDILRTFYYIANDKIEIVPNRSFHIRDYQLRSFIRRLSSLHVKGFGLMTLEDC